MGAEVATIQNGSTKLMPLNADTMSALVIHGDLSKLNPVQKVEYYKAICERVGLDPATQPFKLLKLNGKEVLYCDRGGTAQLNKRDKVSHKITDRRKEDDIYSVIANASTPDGRQTESIGAVSISGLKGDALCNAMMKAETKAKRRSTLDLLGLGMLDESEIETIPGAQAESPQPVKVVSRAPEATDEVRKMWRIWRGKLNQSLLTCKSIEEIVEKEKKFLELVKQGPDIWFQYTYHNETETFHSLAEEHRGRVLQIEEMKTVKWQEEWRQKLEHCEPRDFTGFETMVKNNEWMQSPQNIDLIHARGRELGIKDYVEAEAE